MQPQIISSYDGGRLNADLDATISRLTKEGAYKDMSCVMVVPCFGSIPTRAVASWMNLYAPPNAKFTRMFAVGMEVGDIKRRLQSLRGRRDAELDRHHPVLQLLDPARRDRKEADSHHD